MIKTDEEFMATKLSRRYWEEHLFLNRLNTPKEEINNSRILDQMKSNRTP